MCGVCDEVILGLESWNVGEGVCYVLLCSDMV